jgi:RNA polymerase primary sigma factor
VARKSTTLCKTSVNKIFNFINKYKEYITTSDFVEKFNSQILYDVKYIKDCSEKSIVDFYIDVAGEMLSNGDVDCDQDFYAKLKKTVRGKLAAKYTSSKTHDNIIDIYFNDIKNIYIQNPQHDSDELEFIPENRDIFIKNNLKLVIECAKRYQNLGLPFEDLIQTGNYGLMVAFDKFDKDRANLRNNIIKNINTHSNESFTYEDAVKIIKDNFTYSKNLEQTLSKIPTNGFTTKNDFINWTKTNVKTAVFASVAFQWIRAHIIIELNKYGKIINIPKSIKQEDNASTTIIRLDSLNPHTDDCYHDNQVSDYINNEFMSEDELYEEKEEQELYKELVDDLLQVLPAFENRIIRKKFGIGYPYPMAINDIAESEKLPINKIKYAINNSIKMLSNHSKNKNLTKKLFYEYN